MDFVIDFLYVGDGDAIIIWARKPEDYDTVIFLDGGNTGDGQKVIDHFRTWIEPNLQNRKILGFLNSHPHEDHINGLLEIVEYFGERMSFAIYNDPVECITEEHKERIHHSYLDGEDPDITHLYQTFEQIEKLNKMCSQYNIKRLHAYKETGIVADTITILSPSRDFYVNMVQYFTDVDFLKTVDYAKKSSIVDEELESTKPCDIVDEADDASPENLTGTVLQLTTSDGGKIILTSDAGVDAFDYMDGDGFDTRNIHCVQLPHHGSRRNINSKWIKKFNPRFYIVSAEGNAKHPRKAVVNCIKRNLPNCNVYSTHSSKDTLSYTSNRAVFPNRGWGTATPL